jgi:hypothetical protein
MNPPAPEPSPASRRPHRLRRAAGLALLAFLALAVLALWTARKPGPLLVQTAALLGQDLAMASLQWDPAGRVELRGITVGETGADRPYAQIDYLELRWDWRALARREFEQLRVHGLRLWLSRLPQAPGQDGGAPRATSSTPGFLLRSLILGQCTLWVDNLGEGMPPLPLHLGDASPLVLSNLRLGGAASDPAAAQVQIAEANDVEIRSPYDPLVPVLRFDTIRVGFSWAGIQQHQIDQLSLLGPTIYIGDDLFWFIDRLKTAAQEARTGPPPPPWTLSDFRLLGGRLMVTTFGRPGFTLPFVFSTPANATHSVVLGNFKELPLLIPLLIEENNLAYPEYNLVVQGMRGQLFLSVPPKTGSENLVSYVELDRLSWQQIDFTQLYITLTFDPTGIFAQIKGNSAGGYLGADLSIFADRGLEWIASGWSERLGLEPLTQRLSPEHVLVDGSVSGKFIVEGKLKELRRLVGNVAFDEPGHLHLTAVDDVLEKLPPGWELTKQDLARIGLQTLQHYDFDTGRCEFHLAPPKSFLQLDLDGKQGSRNFLLQWTDLRELPGLRW